MTKIEYANEVKTILENLTDKEVFVKEVQKNNGITYTGVVVRDNGRNIAPTFYVENFIDKPIEEMVQFILNFKDTNNTLSLEQEAKEVIENRDMAIKRLQFRLVNKEKNKDLNRFTYDLSNGLVAEFGIRISEGRIPITHEIAEYLNLNSRDAYKIALKNMSDDVEIIDMIEYMCELHGIPKIFIPDDQPPMYIITNKEKNYGAYAILTEGMKQKLTELLGEFTIIPSSIHEVLAIPKVDNGFIRMMVNDVNTNVLASEDYLSDDVFVLTDDGDLLIA